MNYLDFTREELPQPPAASSGPLVYDLFAGCGGLALGFESVGFRTVGFEMLEDACLTYSSNLRRECHRVFLEPGMDLGPRPDVIIGGPPCQPFSVGGLQNGHRDERNGFPAFLSAVERYEPKMVLFENVRGMQYRNRAYFQIIMHDLHLFGYKVEYRILNAVRYGVPQRRERLFVVGHKGTWESPKPTTPARYFTAGEALGTLLQSMPDCPRFLTQSMDEYVAKYEKASHCINPRDLHLDEPARTVTCRNLNGATGDMLRIRLPDGRRRRITVREGARLQGFPDWFQFFGSEGSQFNQVGNSVPPLLAKAIARSVATCLLQGEQQTLLLSPDEIPSTQMRQLPLGMANA
jgi:DNA (cytosine-5)-methyltransferase 1